MKGPISFRCSSDLEETLRTEASISNRTISDVIVEKLGVAIDQNNELPSVKKQLQEALIKIQAYSEKSRDYERVAKILNNENFIRLFRQVEGKTDTWILNGEKISLTYEKPIDLLDGISKQFKLKTS